VHHLALWDCEGWLETKQREGSRIVISTEIRYHAHYTPSPRSPLLLLPSAYYTSSTTYQTNIGAHRAALSMIGFDRRHYTVCLYKWSSHWKSPANYWTRGLVSMTGTCHGTTAFTLACGVGQFNKLGLDSRAIGVEGGELILPSCRYYHLAGRSC